MSNDEYNGRLWQLMVANAEYPFKGITVVNPDDGAKSMGLWCKALMDVYETMRRKGADARMKAAGAGFTNYDAFNPNPADTAALADSGEVMRYPLRPGIMDTVLYEQIASVFKVELKEFLERAETSSLSKSDKTLFAFLRTCIEPPEPATRDPLLDF